MQKIILLIVLFASVKANAQMGEAQKMKWSWDTAVDLSSTSVAVWDLLKETNKWDELSNGFVTSVNVTGEHPNQVRTLRFADGRERKDEVAQYQPEYKMIVIKLRAPLPAGIREGMMAFFITSKDEGGTQLRIAINVNGDAGEKQKLVEELSKEAAAYVRGLKNKLVTK